MGKVDTEINQNFVLSNSMVVIVPTNCSMAAQSDFFKTILTTSYVITTTVLE